MSVCVFACLRAPQLRTIINDTVEIGTKNIQWRREIVSVNVYGTPSPSPSPSPSSFKTVYNTGSCFGFRVPVCGFWVPVVCSESLFCVMRQRITQHVQDGGGGGRLQKKWHITKKGDVLQKTGTWNPQTGIRTRNKNQCYCRPLKFCSTVKGTGSESVNTSLTEHQIFTSRY